LALRAGDDFLRLELLDAAGPRTIYSPKMPAIYRSLINAVDIE
jgi:hypothetical protein